MANKGLTTTERRNGVVRVPLRTTPAWPPAWLKSPTAPAAASPPPPVVDGIDMPVNWRWRAACWPPAKWAAWTRLVDKLRQHGATVSEIEAAEREAYGQMTQREQVCMSAQTT